MVSTSEAFLLKEPAKHLPVTTPQTIYPQLYPNCKHQTTIYSFPPNPCPHPPLPPSHILEGLLETSLVLLSGFHLENFLREGEN